MLQDEELRRTGNFTQWKDILLKNAITASRLPRFNRTSIDTFVYYTITLVAVSLSVAGNLLWVVVISKYIDEVWKQEELTLSYIFIYLHLP